MMRHERPAPAAAGRRGSPSRGVGPTGADGARRGARPISAGALAGAARARRAGRAGAGGAFDVGGRMSPEPAARRTLELVDELGLLWGPAGRVSLSVHHLPHDVLHALGGRTGGYRDADGACLTTRLGSPLVWEVVWFADADPACEACRALLDGFDAATDANAGAPPDSVGPPP